MKGHQIVRDYTWEVNHLSNIELSNYIFENLEILIYNSPLKIVHKKLTLLPLILGQSEIGSTACFSLDSSHCAFHIYYETKLLAIDLFGCGSANLNHIMDEFEKQLFNLPNAFKRTYENEMIRFHS
jgi:S-adenosylmethionine/arginine decarboxylase-like enzyme